MASNITPTATTAGSTKLRVLLIPYFATSHIQHSTELAIRLAAANDAVEATVAVTPASVSIVQSLVDREHNEAAVKIATYPFPTVEGIPKGVENLGKAATPEDSLRIEVAATSASLTRPAQEALIRAQSPDAIVTDMLFPWNGDISDELGVPCIAFSVTCAFTMLAMRHIADPRIADDADDDSDAVTVPRFPGPRIRIPRRELPLFLRRQEYSHSNACISLQAGCFGFAMNTSSELEKQYCEMFTREGYVKRAYFLGPVAVAPPPSMAAAPQCLITDWLDSKPDRSVVYVCFGSLSYVKDAQLDELALGLETSGESFLWVVRGKEEWSPPKGWEERVQDRGLVLRVWAPQTAILGHPAVGAFLTHCGWNSVLEAVVAGVPVLTWPMFFDQFITERLVTEVLGIGERLWPDGDGVRVEGYLEHEVIPGQDVARALTRFMRPGGPGDMARIKAKNLAAKADATVAQGGSSHRDLHRLVDDLLLMAAAAKRRPT